MEKRANVFSQLLTNILIRLEHLVTLTKDADQPHSSSAGFPMTIELLTHIRPEDLSIDILHRFIYYQIQEHFWINFSSPYSEAAGGGGGGEGGTEMLGLCL